MPATDASRNDELLDRFDRALDTVRELSSALQQSLQVNEDELERALAEFYRSIKNCCNDKRLDPALAGERGIRRDVLETWQDHSDDHLPVSLALLQKRSNVDNDPARPQPKTLVLMAGFSAEQLVLSIAFHYFENGIRHVMPFAGKTRGGGTSWSDGIGDRIDQGLQILGIKKHFEDDENGLRIEEPEPVDASNPARVFQSILLWHRKTPNRSCMLDVTGGQKPMDSGASYAAMYLGWPAYYLDFEHYDDKLRRPEPQSLRYSELLLPNVAFSHNSRREVVSHFHGKRFRLGLERLMDLVKPGEDPKYKEFFPQEDKDDIQSAARFFRQCVSLMGADYDSDTLRPIRPELHSQFKPPASDQPSPPSHQQSRKTLHQLMQPASASRDSDPLLQYVADEYWRLKTLLELAKGSSDTDDSAVRYSEGIRDVIVGTVGLCELIIDSLFALPQCCLSIEKLTAWKPVGVKGLKNDRAEELGTDETVASQIQEQLCRQEFPFHRIPPSVPGSKERVLRGKTEKWVVYCPSKSFEPSDFNKDNVRDFIAKIADVFRGQGPGTRNESRFELSVKVRLKEKLIDADKAQWAEAFGAFGDGEAEWFGTRHLIAHMRAPMTRNHFSLAEKAIDTYVPHFVGLLSIVRKGNATFPIHTEQSLTAGNEFLEDWEEKIPWCDPRTRKQLLQWLRLPTDDELSDTTSN